jgi:delta 1-pyrroline-5-carboxylate dehydrogenase
LALWFEVQYFSGEGLSGTGPKQAGRTTAAILHRADGDGKHHGGGRDVALLAGA